MRKLLFSIMVGIAVLLVVEITSVGNIGNLRAVDAESSTEEQPIVYVSTDPNVCLNFSQTATEYMVFVNAPLGSNLCGISFDLDIDGNVPSPPIPFSSTGVTLNAANLSQLPYHFEATWTSRPLEHEPIIRLWFASEEPWIEKFSPNNVTFETTGGSSVPGYGIETWTHVDNFFYCYLHIFASDRVSVAIGGTTIIPFHWEWDCWTFGSAPITVSDTEEWVVSWEPESAGGEDTCNWCIVPVYDGWVKVFVPEGVPVGTTSALSIVGLNSTAEVILEADDEVSANNSTWGEIKSLYH